MKINIGDVVEVQYPTQRNWDGIQFRVTEQDKYSTRGEVTKTVPSQAKKYPVGSKFSWSMNCEKALVVVRRVNRRPMPKPEPTENQVYIDHIYERLIQNATKQELLILTGKLESFITGKPVQWAKMGDVCLMMAARVRDEN